MKFHLTTEARKDLVAIAKYTEQNWGKEQRNKYLERIDSTFHIISKFPDSGKKCGEIKK